MNRMQKISWLMVISMGSGLILSAIAVTIGYLIAGFPKAWAGLGLLGLAGFAGLGPLIFRKDPGPVQADERDQQINLTAARAGFALSYLVVGLLTMGIWAYFRMVSREAVSVEVLPLIWIAAFMTAMLVHSVMILRLYAKDSKAAEGETV